MTRSDVAHFGFAAIAALVVVVVMVACPGPTSAKAPVKPSVCGGAWEQVAAPAVAPPETVCCVWSGGLMQSRYGGPECFEPEKGVEPEKVE